MISDNTDEDQKMLDHFFVIDQSSKKFDRHSLNFAKLERSN